MRDVIRRFNKTMGEQRRAIKKQDFSRVPAVIVHQASKFTRLAPPVDEMHAERPMSRKQIWARDREGVMADAKQFSKAKPSTKIHWWRVGLKTETVFESCDGSKQKIVNFNSQIEVIDETWRPAC